jgi:hypothetical protein
MVMGHEMALDFHALTEGSSHVWGEARPAGWATARGQVVMKIISRVFWLYVEHL